MKKLTHVPRFLTSTMKPRSCGDKTQCSIVREVCVALRLIYCMPKIGERKERKLNIWNFMFLFFPSRKNFRHLYFVWPCSSIFPREFTIKPSLYYWLGGSGSQFLSRQAFYNKQNGDWQLILWGRVPSPTWVPSPLHVQYMSHSIK